MVRKISALTRQKNKERSQRFYLKNREKRLAYVRKWNEENRDRIRGYTIAHRKKNPLKYKARCLTDYAVASGKIVRPNHCTKCGIFGKPEAHHADYSKPLEVEWLCKSCHRRKHVELEPA